MKAPAMAAGRNPTRRGAVNDPLQNRPARGGAAVLVGDGACSAHDADGGPGSTGWYSKLGPT